MEYNEEIIKNISSTLVDIKISNEGNAIMTLDDFRKITCAVANSTDASSSGSFLLKFCIVSDTKGFFQIVGRSRFDS